MSQQEMYSAPWNIAPRNCEYTATPKEPDLIIKLAIYGYDKPFECMAIENHEGKPVCIIPMDESNAANAYVMVAAPELLNSAKMDNMMSAIEINDEDSCNLYMFARSLGFNSDKEVLGSFVDRYRAAAIAKAQRS